MINMEQLWKDYMTFEQNINPIIAEKMAIERSRDYMNARRVAKELEAVTRGLNRSAPSVPPTGHAEEIKQVKAMNPIIKIKPKHLRKKKNKIIPLRLFVLLDAVLNCKSGHPVICNLKN